MSVEKVDLVKQYKGEYRRGLKPVLIETSAARYLTISGAGEIDESFGELAGHLYNMAYTIKMASKRAGLDYKVCPLEARYWVEGQTDPYGFAAAPMAEWRWRILVRTPDFIGEAQVALALEALLAKGKSRDLEGVGLIDFEAGRCAQVLHVGPYTESMSSAALLGELAEASGLRPIGRHHEIYLSDPRRVPAEKLKTLLRVAVG